MKKLFIRGQVPVLALFIAGFVTLGGSALTAWATANSRVNKIDTKVQVIEERESNHYKELKEGQDEILDAISNLNMSHE